MNLNNIRRGRFFYVCVFSLTLGACGGGGSGGDTDNGGTDNGGGESPEYACADTGAGTVTISGKVEYEFVPAAEGGFGTGVHLDFANSEPRPIRQAEVVALCPDGSVEYGSTTSSDLGEYSVSVPSGVDAVIRVRARLFAEGAPSWHVRVLDNTSSQAVWAAEGDVITAVSADTTADLFADSGWTGTGYTETRAAAPFAILDSVYTAMFKVMEADPLAEFPPLKINWSPKNTTCEGTTYPFTDGCIGTSFFFNLGGTDGRNIFILGDKSGDTDEFDNHVVIHEWGHYYEDAFSRSDSIGGAHSGGNKIDPRVAFGEGWGNAWAGIATGDPLYIDTSGSTHEDGFSIDVEDAAMNQTNSSGGWWDETSIQEILYDLYDGGNEDGVELGFAPLHHALTTQQRTTEAMTTIFSLVHYLRDNDPAAAADIDTLLADHGISLVEDFWGDNRTGMDDGSVDFGTTEYFSPVHTDLMTVNDGSTANICTAQNEVSSTSEHNRLGVRRFLRFKVGASGNWFVKLDSDLSGKSDPDFVIFASGVAVTGEWGTPSSGQDDSASDADGAGVGVETATVTLASGPQYVIEVLDWMNADDDPATGGDNVCLDLTFELAP